MCVVDVLQAQNATPVAFAVTPAAARVLADTGLRAVELFEQHLAADWSEVEVMAPSASEDEGEGETEGFRLSFHALPVCESAGCLVVLSNCSDCWLLAPQEFCSVRD
jgi:hypothetical protein